MQDPPATSTPTAPPAPAAPAGTAPAVLPPAAARPSANASPPPVRRWMIAAVAALAVAAALAGWVDSRRAAQSLRAEVAAKIGEIDAVAQTTGQRTTQLAAEVRDAQAKIALLEARLAESQAQQASLEALYRDLAPSRDEIALTEIEQLLLLASQQLSLAGNVPSALSALQLADGKLQRLDRPQFTPLRRALARDIDRLKAMPFVDLAGLSVKLDQAATAVATLPLARDERLPIAKPDAALPPEAPWWRRVGREIWNDVRGLMRIEVADRPAAPLLAPSQEYFLRENLRLRLLSARLALLAREDAGFRSDLAAADGWIRQYFDLRAKPVQAVQATLKQLAATPLGAEAPDLGRTLDAVRVLRAAQERQPARAPAAGDKRPAS